MRSFLIVLLAFIFFFNCKAQNGLVIYPDLPAYSAFDKRGQSGIAVDDSGRVWMSFDGVKLGQSFMPSKIGLLTIGSDSIWKEVNVDSLGGPATKHFTSIEFVDNALWIGSDKGLIKKAGNTWQLINQNSSLPDTVNNFKILGKRIYLATQNGVKVNYRVGFSNFWVHYNTSNSSLPTNKINAIDIDKDGNFWLASNLGVLRFNPSINQCKIFDERNSDFVSKEILSIKVLPNGEVWAGTTSNGVNETAAGLFFLESDKFNHIMRRFGLKAFELIPKVEFSTIISNGNKIVFPAHCDKNDKRYLMWFELEGMQVEHYFLPMFNTNTYAGILALCKQKDDYYFSINGQFQTLKLTLSDLAQDSSYYYQLMSMDTSTNFNTKEITSVLDINNLHAPLMVRGDLFFLNNSSTTYLSVNSNAHKRLSYTAGLWMGGLSDGNLHLAASTYRQSGIDYGQGPLKIGSASTDAETRLKFARMWKIEERELNEFRNNFNKPNYAIPKDILTWPAHGDSLNGYASNLAPFVDVNANGIYEPQNGDYPKITGQQNIFWVFNDSIQFHGESNGVPLGVEVQCNAYAYVCNEIDDLSIDKAINNTIFLRYKIINRSNRVYSNFSTALFIDNSLGDYSNDRVGSNPKESYSYWYNGDSIDKGILGFGNHLPACALVMLKGFKGDDDKVKGAHKMVSYRNDFSQFGNPRRPEHYYNYLQGKWKDGRAITYGGQGFNGTDSQEVWMFPGAEDLLNRPIWTEENGGVMKGDKRHLLIPENITFEPGETQEIEFALVYTPTQFNQKDLVLQHLHSDVLKVKDWYRQNNFPACSNVPLGSNQTNSIKNEFDFTLYPNPSSDVISIRGSHRIEQLLVFDITGKLLKNLIGENLTKVEVDDLTPGIYLIQIHTKEGVLLKKIIKE